jgi:aryl-alcohol dehydrogenase-like predicted oxidoreductase
MNLSLTSYRTLGRSGLAVSPLALGTMTFGLASWGAGAEVSEAILQAYVEAGGNFIDTADMYANGQSEAIIGSFIANRKLRDQVVLATKFGFSVQAGNPNAAGNGRKQVYRALEGSLRRLQTDYIDLYWLHVWDMLTPAAEVLQTMGDLIRAGKIRYFGLSDVPAWYATQMATLAQAQGVPGPIAIQMEYSLVERTSEREHLPAAKALGMGFVPWSPLAGGFLTGKYAQAQRQSSQDQSERRLDGPNPFSGPFDKFTERNWEILRVLRAVAGRQARPLAQVALAWAAGQPGVSSTIIGARNADQALDNIASLDIQLSPADSEALAAASAPSHTFPYALFTPEMRRAAIFGGADVEGWA